MENKTEGGSPAKEDAKLERQLLHHRSIDFQGYRRIDGLYEIEARMVDRKPVEFDLPNGGRRIGVNEAIHDLSLNICFDKSMKIVDVFASPKSFPYSECQCGGNALRNLIGLEIGSGWSRNIRDRVSNKDVCTHLRELLIPLATAAIQSMHLEKEITASNVDDTGKPIRLNSCLAYNESGQLVKSLWPRFYKPKSSI